MAKFVFISLALVVRFDSDKVYLSADAFISLSLRPQFSAVSIVSKILSIPNLDLRNKSLHIAFSACQRDSSRPTAVFSQI